MSIRKIPLLVGEYYHIYNRGVDKRNIFNDLRDYMRFVMLLYLCNGTEPIDMRKIFENHKGKAFVEIFKIKRGNRLVSIGAFCLMPNHFHLLIKEQAENGTSIFMQRLSTAYTMYFNSRYERSGSLFEGKFKAKHVDSEQYFNWVFSYIHLNPVKMIDKDWKEKGISNPEKAEKFMKEYKYSSFYDYFIDDRMEGVILNKEEFPEYFSKMNDFSELIQEFRSSGF